ncbi:MAG TPA: XRE family transcriptional regulator [Tepidisphaeraceae bacterium]|jgi:predicted XRE-type DNA-binding protein|nr:XRE family transcriptional regulator [Tepidisphaeraceae bacterium]
MSKIKPVTTRSADELANALGLSPADAVKMDIRRRLNDKIVDAVARSGLTHAQVASRARTSRTRLTAILNRNTHHASTDLMLRILAALGYRAKITFTRPARAA